MDNKKMIEKEIKKKEYIAPMVEVIADNNEDIIQTSTAMFWQDDEEFYN